MDSEFALGKRFASINFSSSKIGVWKKFADIVNYHEMETPEADAWSLGLQYLAVRYRGSSQKGSGCVWEEATLSDEVSARGYRARMGTFLEDAGFDVDYKEAKAAKDFEVAQWLEELNGFDVAELERLESAKLSRSSAGECFASKTTKEVAEALLFGAPCASPPRADKELAAKLSVLNPMEVDWSSIDAANRGDQRNRAQWLLDLICVAGMQVNEETDAGYPIQTGGPYQWVYMGLASELSKKCKPGTMLEVDDKVPYPQVPFGKKRGMWRKGCHPGDNALEVLSSWIFTTSSPYVHGSAVADLFENLLEGVSVSEEDARKALDSIYIHGNYDRCHDTSFRDEDLARMMRAIKASCPTLGTNGLTFQSVGDSLFKKYFKHSASEIASFDAIAEMVVLDGAASLPASRSPAPRV